MFVESACGFWSGALQRWLVIWSAAGALMGLPVNVWSAGPDAAVNAASGGQQPPTAQSAAPASGAIQAGQAGPAKAAVGNGAKNDHDKAIADDAKASRRDPKHADHSVTLSGTLVQDGPTPALHAVLTHEWAHIRNGDLWLLALGRCLLVLLFAHPLFWWLRRAIRGDQELLADAAAAGDNRQGYAEELLALVRRMAHPSPITGSVGIWES